MSEKRRLHLLCLAAWHGDMARKHVRDTNPYRHRETRQTEARLDQAYRHAFMAAHCARLTK